MAAVPRPKVVRAVAASVSSTSDRPKAVSVYVLKVSEAVAYIPLSAVVVREASAVNVASADWNAEEACVAAVPSPRDVLAAEASADPASVLPNPVRVYVEAVEGEVQ